MLYDITITQFTKMLQNLSLILDHAAAHADAKKFEMEVLLNTRLAPDQFCLLRQVQIACDTATVTRASKPLCRQAKKVASGWARMSSVNHQATASSMRP